MKSRPILYSTAMVNAKRAGRKRMTRRIAGLEDVNAYPGRLEGEGPMGPLGYRGLSPSGYYIRDKKSYAKHPGEFHWFVGFHDGEINPIPVRCPYGAPGDHLWTQEGYRLSGLDGLDAALSAGTGLTAVCHYLADGEQREVLLTPEDVRKLAARRTDRTRPLPGRFMYQSCSRDTDVLTEVRCERLQDITEEDAIAEGAASRPSALSGYGGRRSVGWSMDWGRAGQFSRYASGGPGPLQEPDIALPTARMAFANYWIMLHGQASWDRNPFVWVLSYHPLESA